MTAIARVDYIELSGARTDTLKSFYGDAFGWTFRDPAGNELAVWTKYYASRGHRRTSPLRCRRSGL